MNAKARSNDNNVIANAHGGESLKIIFNDNIRLTYILIRMASPMI